MDRSLTGVFLLLSVFIAGVELASIPLKLKSGVQDVAANAAAPVVWNDCSHDHKFMKVDDVVIHPNPPKLGATVDIQATIETYKNISEGAKIKLSVTQEGSPISFEKTYDLCELVKKLKLSCPLPSKFDLHLSRSIPSFIPKAKYNGKAVVQVDNQDAACFTVELNFTG